MTVMVRSTKGKGKPVMIVGLFLKSGVTVLITTVTEISTKILFNSVRRSVKPVMKPVFLVNGLYVRHSSHGQKSVMERTTTVTDL